MKKEILKRIFIIVLLTILIITNLSMFNISNAAKKANEYVTAITSTDPNIEDNGGKEIRTIINRIIGIVQVIAFFTAVFMLVQLGMKYMMASPEGKADIKKHTTVYVIGASVMFGATGILQILKDFFVDATA